MFAMDTLCIGVDGVFYKVLSVEAHGCSRAVAALRRDIAGLRGKASGLHTYDMDTDCFR